MRIFPDSILSQSFIVCLSRLIYSCPLWSFHLNTQEHQQQCKTNILCVSRVGRQPSDSTSQKRLCNIIFVKSFIGRRIIYVDDESMTITMKKEKKKTLQAQVWVWVPMFIILQGPQGSRSIESSSFLPSTTNRKTNKSSALMQIVAMTIFKLKNGAMEVNGTESAHLKQLHFHRSQRVTNKLKIYRFLPYYI